MSRSATAFCKAALRVASLLVENPLSWVEAIAACLQVVRCDAYGGKLRLTSQKNSAHSSVST
ncbi:hypothetical protein [Nostoc sp.]|uniref:hypothetical protein n=1 Tax=Nostoc sp. TaxID=1180 RepID=UPI002FF4B250